MPFAVVGSNAVVESHGKKIRGRVYPWGVVEGEWCEDVTTVQLLQTVFYLLSSTWCVV